MSALELISLANQVLFIGLFVAVLWHAVRQPSRTSADTVMLFGSVATAVVVARGTEWLGMASAPWVTPLLFVLLSVPPLAMLRLVDDFSATPRWVQHLGTGAFVVVALLALFASGTQERVFELAIIVWFVVVGGYAAFAFAREAARTHGITRRRMTAVAAGAVLFIGAVVLLFVNVLVPGPTTGILVQLMAFMAVLAFFLGFAPPAWVRRAWREPDLRGFLERSIHLAGMPDERRAIVEIQQAAAAAFGATGAAIGLSDRAGRLRYLDPSGEWVEYPDDAFISGRAFREQRRVVSLHAVASDPEYASVYRSYEATTVIAAPITSKDRRIGVLTIYADRAPIFVEDDLWLLELLAGQVAVLLDARTLATNTASIRSREESARLKEEFLSSAAHDLRTPLTVVLGQAELLERRLARDPSGPVDAASVRRIAREARRLRDLVTELLDAQRLEEGAAVIARREVDLREVVRAVQERFSDHGLHLRLVEPDRPLFGSVDPARIEQMLDNLVENALKYTSRGGELPELHLRREGEELRIVVMDHGVGIPDHERERIFDRFYRASNVQGIADTGMGLGLYICRRIVEAHGGRIWVEPTPGGGSTFIAAIPDQPAAPSVPESAPPLQVNPREATADA